MIEAIGELLRNLLGLERDVSDVGAIQMAVRTIVIYAFTLAIVRLGSKRFLSEATAFDVIIAIMVGSVMSRAINGSAPFFPTLVSGAVFIGMHTFLALLAFRTTWFGPVVKGEPVLLIRDGQINWPGMVRANLTLNDLAETLRLEGLSPDPSKVRLACLERNGKISIIPYEKELRVVDVPVEDGTKTVRIELE